MNSTQYLIILITAVVCFCIYVLADIWRMHQREIELFRRTDEIARRMVPMAEPIWPQSIDPHFGVDSRRNVAPLPVDNQGYKGSSTSGNFQGNPTRLQEEIRTRLEGGDGA